MFLLRQSVTTTHLNMQVPRGLGLLLILGAGGLVARNTFKDYQVAIVVMVMVVVIMVMTITVMVIMVLMVDTCSVGAAGCGDGNGASDHHDH